MQRSLFDDNEPDPAGARQARDRGIGEVDANADRLWRAEARAAIRACAAQYEDFTSDEVLQYLARHGTAGTHNMAALGPVFLAAAKAGEIEKTGYLRPTAIRRRHRDLTVWRGRG